MSDFLDRISKLPPKKLAILAMQLQQKVEALQRAKTEPIAVVGIGCRFPGGVSSPDDFWRLLANGVDAIADVPADRWDVDAYFDPNPDAPGKMYSRSGGFLADVDRFDPLFFGIAPREAIQMDPQHRLVLEVAWEALEHAGVPPDSLAGSRAGVFVGITASDYVEILRLASAADDAHSLTGNGISFSAGRVSYTFGLHGPSMAVDTACSSSLVAVHLACQSLRLNECRVAMAGGVNLILSPSGTIATSRAHMLAPDGRCKTFDATADGYVRSEGCGIVVLKRASDAVADGDRILAVIRGSAVNQDGRTSGLTVPSGPAQQNVIRLALADAGIEPAQVDYVEAHGTGTSLGDPIEVEALRSVFGPSRPAERPLVLGAVKTNLGHLESAAGIASLIKVVLMLQHGTIPAHLHFTKPNPLIALGEIPAVVPTQPMSWRKSDRRRVAGVSSFGASGTNAHVVLEEAAPVERAGAVRDRPAHLLTVSARTAAALSRAARRLLERWPAELSAADIAFTQNAGRTHFAHRVALVGRSAEEMRTALASAAIGESAAGIHAGVARAGTPPKIAFVFGDRASAAMGELYDTQPTFRKALDDADRILSPLIGRSVVMALSAGGDGAAGRAEVFALQHALAALWASWGIKPSAVVGDGIGECAAAVVAGVLDLETAARFAAARDRQQAQNGSVGDIQQLARTASYATPRIGIASARTGRFPARDEVVTPEYWTRASSAASRLSNALEALASDHPIVVGIGSIVESDRPRSTTAATDRVWLSCAADGLAWTEVLSICAELYVRGVAIDWRGFDADYFRSKVALPTYPFERERYWVDVPPPRPAESSGALGEVDDLGRDFYSIAWRTKPVAPNAAPADMSGRWLIFEDSGGIGRDLGARLAAAGGNAVFVAPGTEFQRVSSDACVIDPLRADDYDRLWRDLVGERAPRGILHLWTLDVTLPPDAAEAPAHAAVAAASSSVVHLARVAATAGDNLVPRVWIVTRNAQAADGYATVAAEQAPAWGLARVLAIEQPAMKAVRIDLDPVRSAFDGDAIWKELAASDAEDQVVYRGGIRRVARLARTAVAVQRGRSLALNPDATYLITGGAGGLGRRVATWMVERGARSLVLVGRRDLDADADPTYDELRRAGARVTYHRGDVACLNDVRAILRSIAADLPPLRGIVHAAGILDDGLVAGQSWPQIERVLAPKMSGAWNLHRATRDLPLDFFVLFSSGASLIGSAGQANYAAGNAFLDALAHARRATGLPAMAINWGPWAEVGMAAATDARARDRWTAHGWTPLSPTRALAALERLIGGDAPPQVAVMPVDWEAAFAAARRGEVAPLFAELADPATAPAGGGEIDGERLRETPPETRAEAVSAFVRDEVIRALRVPPSAFAPDTPLTELGMDSLMALELRNRIQAKLGVAVPLADLVGGLSPRAVADVVCAKLETPTASRPAATSGVDASAILERLPELSDQEVDTLLARILANESRVS